MRTPTRQLAAGAVALAMLVPAAAAQARTKDVIAGPAGSLKGAPKGGDVNQFFPRKVTVNAGDTVRFQFRGFHTATFLKKGQKPPAPFMPDPSGGTATGFKDAAGQPFWFNGQPRFVFNPEVAAPAGDAKIDGKSYDNSGVANGPGAPPPYPVKLLKPGKYSYLCLIHPHMKGTVVVKKKGKKVPSAAKDKSTVAKQLAKSVKELKRLGSFSGPAAGTVQMGNDSKRVSFLKFFPETLTVKAGQPVTFQMPAVTDEIHTVTFGPEPYLQSLIDGFVAPDTSAPQGGPPTLVVNPQAQYPSDAPPSFPPYDGTNHGNGFFSTGVLLAGGQKTAIAFSKPGTYKFLCLVHGKDMSGTITVTG